MALSGGEAVVRPLVAREDLSVGEREEHFEDVSSCRFRSAGEKRGSTAVSRDEPLQLVYPCPVLVCHVHAVRALTGTEPDEANRASMQASSRNAAHSILRIDHLAALVVLTAVW